MKANAKAEEDAAIAEAFKRAAAEKREQEEAKRAHEAKRHALRQAEAQKAAQYDTHFAKPRLKKRHSMPRLRQRCARPRLPMLYLPPTRSCRMS